MASQVSAYTTKQLSPETWPDLEKLFSQKNGWDLCWCMHFYRPCRLPRNQWLPTRAERGVQNRRAKRELVEKGCAHGILVYANGEPVGWCQYGPKQELPRIDNSRKYQGLAPKGAEKLENHLLRGAEAVSQTRGGERGVESRSRNHKKPGRRPGGGLSHHALGNGEPSEMHPRTQV